MLELRYFKFCLSSCFISYLFIYLFIYIFIYVFIYLFIHSFIYLFIYFVRVCVQFLYEKKKRIKVKCLFDSFILLLFFTVVVNYHHCFHQLG